MRHSKCKPRAKGMPSEQPSDGISISASAAVPLLFPDCNPMDNVSPFTGENRGLQPMAGKFTGVTAIPRYPLQPHRLNGYSIKMPSETLRSFRRHLSFPNYKSNSAATGAWSLGRSKARVSKSTRTSFKTAAISDVTNIWSIRRPSLRWNIAPR